MSKLAIQLTSVGLACVHTNRIIVRSGDNYTAENLLTHIFLPSTRLISYTFT